MHFTRGKERGRGIEDDGGGTTLYGIGMTIMAVTSLYICVQTHSICNKSQPWCKLWTLGDNDVQMEIHQLSQMYHSVGNLDNGGGFVWVGMGGWLNGKSLYILLNCAVNLKLLYKKRSIFKSLCNSKYGNFTSLKKELWKTVCIGVGVVRFWWIKNGRLPMTIEACWYGRSLHHSVYFVRVQSSLSWKEEKQNKKNG